MKKLLMLGLVFLLVTSTACKSKNTLTTLTKSHSVKDTILREEVKEINPPQRNVIILEQPCKDNKLNINDQIIKNDVSEISIKKSGKNINIQINIDSIVNQRISELRIKKDIQYVEIPVEVIKEVKNPVNLKLLIGLISVTLLLFRKPIFILIKKLINPLSF